VHGPDFEPGPQIRSPGFADDALDDPRMLDSIETGG
jgi:hypothetical protein